MNTLYKKMLERGKRNRARAKAYRASGKSDREIGVLLGMSRQAVHKMIFERKLKSVRRLGPVNKPIYVVRTAEVLKAVKPPR